MVGSESVTVSGDREECALSYDNNAATSNGRRLHPCWAILLGALALVTIPGCQSIGRGAAEAIIQAAGQEGPDTRLCEVEGKPFGGVASMLEAQQSLSPISEADPGRPQEKVLYVHGIGFHRAGHAETLITNLARALDLNVRAPRPKQIQLVAPMLKGAEVGVLQIHRLTDNERKRDLLFYELTWSPINDAAREAVAFDLQPFYGNRRASLNRTTKLFTNDVLPDALAYTGVNRELIRASIAQSLCWMTSSTWGDLAEETTGKACGPDSPGFASRIGKDQLMFITHSLGSRITIDGLQALVPALRTSPVAAYRRAHEALSRSDVTIFMLSNQLPLIEVGMPPQQDTGNEAQYCGPDAPKSAERSFNKTRIVAFSDPNDLMSYQIPTSFARRYLDSRLCPEITNVNINISPVVSLLGYADAANPMEAHVGYDGDPRVGDLIAKGAGGSVTVDRCTFKESDESLMR